MGRILLVEDNPAEVSLFKEALAENDTEHAVEVATDGQVALDMLLDQKRLRPDLIVLDLNMPRMSGLEVLEKVKRTPSICDVPVVILTSSVDDGDIGKAYQRGVNAYLHKPMGYAEFVDLVGTLERFWLKLVTLPQASHRAGA
jgi:CheY-like chemotaxis protein